MAREHYVIAKAVRDSADLVTSQDKRMRLELATAVVGVIRVPVVRGIRMLGTQDQVKKLTTPMKAQIRRCGQAIIGSMLSAPLVGMEPVSLRGHADGGGHALDEPTTRICRRRRRQHRRDALDLLAGGRCRNADVDLVSGVGVGRGRAGQLVRIFRS